MPTPKTTVRNKDNSKQKLLDAVGKILKTKGFMALKVNDIAATAGLDKKLIYKYFGGRDNLVDEYIKSLDYWSNITQDDAPVDFSDGGRNFTKGMLLQQYDYMSGNDEFQKLMLWGLYESRKSLKKVGDEREAAGELLLTNITDPFFGKNAVDFRAAMAVVISGIYYLNMFAGVNGNTFCGVDVTTPEGRERIKGALATITDLIYNKLGPQTQTGGN